MRPVHTRRIRIRASSSPSARWLPARHHTAVKARTLLPAHTPQRRTPATLSLFSLRLPVLSPTVARAQTRTDRTLPVRIRRSSCTAARWRPVQRHIADQAFILRRVLIARHRIHRSSM